MSRSHLAFLLPSLVALSVLAARVAGLAPRTAAAQPPEGPIAYELVGTWAEVPWTLTAGRYGAAADISSAPDGRIYVLDSAQGAVHVLAPDGTAERVFGVPALGYELTARRLDVGFDGQLYVLSGTCERCSELTQIEKLTPDGASLARHQLFERYSDLALRADGRMYLTRPGDSGLLGRRGVDVYGPIGSYQETLAPPEMDSPYRVDVGADGTVYVLQDVVVPEPPRPGEPGPRPTPGPSGLDVPAQPPAPVPGVVIFEPSHRYVETVPFDFGLDVAVGPGAVFVARYGQVYPLRQSQPLTPPQGQRWTGSISLDVPPDGRVLGSLSHCYFQGVLIYDAPVRWPAHPRLTGALDNPELEGPVYPLRVAAGAGAALLQGRYELTEMRPDPKYATRPVLPQSVQRWSSQGELAYQLGLCTRTRETAWARDVALDGGDVYTIDSECLERRPDDRFPAWQACPQGLWGAGVSSHLAAVDALGGRVAVLDAGAGGVILFDPSGAPTAQWAVGGSGPVSLPVDLALGDGRVFLADEGRSLVQVRALDGQLQAEWPTPDRPVAVAVGPAGEVFVLGRGGWAFRLAGDGRLTAAWSMPDPELPARDIAVLDDGRVLVPYARFEPAYGSWETILAAGVWVFAPGRGPAADLPTAAGCTAAPDKRAAPSRIALGGEVNVTLSVQGRCPDRMDPMRLAIVFDTSRSMDWGYALAAAKQAVLALLGHLDPRLTEVTLVTFADSAALAEPPTRDLLRVGRVVSALQADGDTQMAGGMELARQLLAAPGRDPAARPVLLLVTDANPKDATEDALLAARGDGIELDAFIFQAGQRADPLFLNLFNGSGGQALFDPQEEQVRRFAAELVRAVPMTELFEEIRILDDVPANMRYVAGSAQPPAQLDAATGRLSWTLTDVAAADGVGLSYRLLPLECGLWPTNVRAVADYRDALGQAGHLDFPVPFVQVERCAERVYLPFLAKQSCFRADRPVDVVLVLDTSQSMAEAAPAGGTKLDAARAAARQFLSVLRLPQDRAAVVSFDAGGRRAAGLTGDRAALAAALAGLTTSPGTRIDLGLAEARAVLAAARRAEARPVVVLLSDGLQSGPAEPVLAEAAAIKSSGATVYTVGLGADIDRALLATVATSPDRLYVSPTATQLAAIYDEISERLACEVR
jgi:Mg-chelatase subunit ChlD